MTDLAPGPKWNAGTGTIAAISAAWILLPASAQAYVGPGAGLGMIGSLIAVLAAVSVAVFGLLLFPIRLLLKKRKARAKGLEAESGAGERPPAE